MTEILKTIEIKAYETSQGKPTCALNFNTGQFCKFLGTTKMGFSDICMLSGKEISREDYYTGWFQPNDGCIVWNSVEE